MTSNWILYMYMVKWDWKKTQLLQFQINIFSSLIETIEVVQRALADPTKPVLEEVDPASREEDRKICSENMIHQADLIMRKLIAENMKKASGESVFTHWTIGSIVVCWSSIVCCWLSICLLSYEHMGSSGCLYYVLMNRAPKLQMCQERCFS